MILSRWIQSGIKTAGLELSMYKIDNGQKARFVGGAYNRYCNLLWISIAYFLLSLILRRLIRYINDTRINFVFANLPTGRHRLLLKFPKECELNPYTYHWGIDFWIRRMNILDAGVLFRVWRDREKQAVRKQYPPVSIAIVVKRKIFFYDTYRARPINSADVNAIHREFRNMITSKTIEELIPLVWVVWKHQFFDRSSRS